MPKDTASRTCTNSASWLSDGVTAFVWIACQAATGLGGRKQWQAVTPAMAAGLTDHVWTMEELLSYRVPPDFRDRLDPQAVNNTV